VRDCQPPEKCAPKECANEPKPPRDTWLDPESDEVVVFADELPEEEPPEKKLLREEVPPPEPPEDPRGWHSVGAAIPGGVCGQFWPGISA